MDNQDDTQDFFGGQDTSEIETIKRKLIDLENMVQGINPRNLAGITNKDLRDATRTNIFGDGSDGNIVLDGTTDWNDFSSRSGTTYTLTRDVFGRELIINTGVTLKPAGFRIFASISLTNNGTVHTDGGDGGDGGNGGPGGTGTNDPGGTGGTAGAAAHGAGSIIGRSTGVGKAGGEGGEGTSGASATANADNGVNGDDRGKSVGAAGSAGAGGGAGGFNNPGTSAGSAGTGGNGGSKLGTVYNYPRTAQSAYMFSDAPSASDISVASPGSVSSDCIIFGTVPGSGSSTSVTITVNGETFSLTGSTASQALNDGFAIFVPNGGTWSIGGSPGTADLLQVSLGSQALRESAGSGSGGGGGGARSNNSSNRGSGGGGGGGSGAPGGIMVIFAARIINNGSISSEGGVGGDGGNGGPRGGGGGGGGGGGAGGIIVMCFGSFTGNGSVSVAGGAGGSGGTAGGTGTDLNNGGVAGNSGSSGLSGSLFEIQIG